MMMLYDRDEKLIASLKYNNIVRKRELNGLNTLDFETDREVEYGQRVLFMDKEGLWNEYIIIDYFKNHKDTGVEYSVFCEDSTSELYWSFIEDMKPRNESCSSILMRVLEGTRFEVGRVDDFGLKSFNLYRTSVKAAIWKMIEEYGAEINVRIDVSKNGIEHRYIDLKKSIGRNSGKRYEYNKDIQSIKKTTSIKDLVTALYGFGKGEKVVEDNGDPTGGYGRKLDFSEINGGKKYVADEEARRKYGVGKDRKHIFGRVEFPDCEDKEELLRLTRDKLKELCKPKITYELKVEDVSRYEGYEGEGVGLGDRVIVKDKEMDTLVETRVIAITDNPIEEIDDDSIVLGNYIKDLSDNFQYYDKLKSTLDNDRDRFNDELNKLAKGVKSSYIQSVIDRFNKELNETGGWVYAEPGEGILILNAPKEGNPTQAINLKGGKIAIANHKNPDGSFAYETFGDGDGFTANLIRAGVLSGGKVFFNLEDGTFLIGSSPSDYTMYWDGSTLHFRNVDIDLENNRVIQDLKEKYDLSDEEIKAFKERANARIDEANRRLDNANARIDETEEDLALVNITIVDYVDEYIESQDKKNELVDNYIESQDKKNEVVDETLLDLSNRISVTDGKIDTNIRSLRESIEKIQSEAYDDSELRRYISENYSTITQTDSKIATKVSSMKVDITNDLEDYSDSNLATAKAYTDSKDSSVRNYIQKNYSTITQTDSKIATEVSSVKVGVTNDLKKYSDSNLATAKAYTDSKDSSVRNYIQKNYSTITQTDSKIASEVSSVRSSFNSSISSLSSRISQTANEISTKVSKNGIISAINQSAESIKINASRINLEGDVSVKGEFTTLNNSNDVGIDIRYNTITFQDNRWNGKKFGLVNVTENVDTPGAYALNMGHYQTGTAIISYYENAASLWRPYVRFDRWNYTGDGGAGQPICFYEGVRFMKDSVMHGIIHIKSGSSNTNFMRIRAYSNGLAIENYDGKGLFINSDGRVGKKGSNGVSYL